jgi:hypothetical protein
MAVQLEDFPLKNKLELTVVTFRVIMKQPLFSLSSRYESVFIDSIIDTGACAHGPRMERCPNNFKKAFAGLSDSAAPIIVNALGLEGSWSGE